jgi:hypothetical protein
VLTISVMGGQPEPPRGRKRNLVLAGIAAGGLAVFSCVVCVVIGLMADPVTPQQASSATPERPVPATPAEPDDVSVAADRQPREHVDEVAQAPHPCEGAEPVNVPLAKRVVVAIEPIVQDDRRVLLRVRHNLPEGADLMTEVRGQHFTGQAKVAAEEGCVAAGPFGPGSGLPTGSYVASLSTPYTFVQPHRVQEVLGEAGRNLKGPQVRREDGERFVEVEVAFSMGSAAEAEKADRDRARTRRELRKRLDALVRQGYGMESLRHSDALAVARQCGETMRRLQAEVGTLAAEAEKVGARDVVGVSGMAKLCVSCKETATRSCDIVRESLREMDKASR